jgi:hypothetical protein
LNSHILIQGLGLLATLATLAAFAQRSDGRFRLYATVGSVLWTVHFGLLGAHTAAATAIAIALRQAGSHVLIAKPAHWRLLAGIGFTLVYTAIAWITWQGWYSVLPWIAAVNGTYAFFSLAGARLRSQMLLSDAAGLVNGFAVGSIGGVLAAVAALAINARTIRRLRRELAS